MHSRKYVIFIYVLQTLLFFLVSLIFTRVTRSYPPKTIMLIVSDILPYFYHIPD
jgi:hypothetical protein